MAHIEKFKAAQVPQLVMHNRRLRDAGHYGNERIDGERTRLNYRIGGVPDVAAALGRAADAAPGGRLRKNAVAAFSVVNTLPRDWPEGRDPREYFEACHEYNVATWPTAVSCGMDVHMDETTPHGHDLFLPTDGQGRFAFSRVCPRSAYQGYHDGLRRHLREALGLDLAVVLDDGTRGERSVEMREYKAARDAVEAGRQEAAEAGREAEAARRSAEAARGAQEAAEAARDDAMRQVQRAGMELDRRRRDLDLLERTQDVALESVREVEARRDDLRAQADAQASLRDELAGEVGRLRAERDGLRAEVRDLRAEESRLREAVSELACRLAELRDGLREVVGQVVERAFGLLCAWWRDFGPWAEERDWPMAREAVDRAAGEWDWPDDR